MGKSGSGKSSMKSIIFNNYVAKETRRLGATSTTPLAPSKGRLSYHVCSRRRSSPRKVPRKPNSQSLGLRGVPTPPESRTLILSSVYRQDSFMENYLQNQRGDVFTGVTLLIYVFDIESREFPGDLETFRTVLEALHDGSPNAKVFCLFHKMDLVQEEFRESLFYEREGILRQVTHMYSDIVVLGTSIWDETLFKVPSHPTSPIVHPIVSFCLLFFRFSFLIEYKAWSTIVKVLIPNTELIEAHLKSFAEVLGAEEVVLFERTTFLVVAHVSLPSATTAILDPQRFEKLSSIIKSFKLSCGLSPSFSSIFFCYLSVHIMCVVNDADFGGRKLNSEFMSFELRTGAFSAFIDRLTPTTHVMIVLADPKIGNAQPNPTQSIHVK